MKRLTTSILFLVLIAALHSCKNAPIACFTVTTPADSIKVGHTVNFDPACSSDATSYYWDYGNGLSSVSTTGQTIYDSATTYTVALVATGSGKSASITKRVTVLP